MGATCSILDDAGNARKLHIAWVRWLPCVLGGVSAPRPQSDELPLRARSDEHNLRCRCPEGRP